MMLTTANNSARQHAYLEAMGIQVWKQRPSQEVIETDQSDLHAEHQTEASTEASNKLNWPELARCVADCTACALHKSRRQTVFGVGDTHADWLIIGEAPGDMEDRKGEPFVGPAGQLLNQMLKAIGLQRNQVYIANILKCRPPNNRDPQAEEVQQCMRYLQRQIELIQPKVILAVGRIAAQNLLDVDTPIGRLRGQVFQLEPFGIPLLVTYHPAYLLRTPLAKREAWKDLQLARATYLEACG